MPPRPYPAGLPALGPFVLARGGHPPSPSVFPRARSARNSAQACAHGVCVLGAQGGDLCQEGSTRWSSPPNRYLRMLCFGRRGTAASSPQSPAVGAAAGIPRLHLLLEPPSAATSFHIGSLGPTGALSHPLWYPRERAVATSLYKGPLSGWRFRYGTKI